MFRRRLVGLLLGALFAASSASAQERSQPTDEITFERAMHLARQQGPKLAAARAGVDAAEARIETASGTSERLSAAARQFEDRGLATLERSERLATASYEAGAIPLGELLAVRRKLVHARLDYVDLLLGAATARVELTASTGGSR